jgi:hypothetical protein
VEQNNLIENPPKAETVEGMGEAREIARFMLNKKIPDF